MGPPANIDNGTSEPVRSSWRRARACAGQLAETRFHGRTRRCEGSRRTDFHDAGAGRDAWQAIGRAESFEAWKSIGAALAIGKAAALKLTGANAAWGRNYSRAFHTWMAEHGFGDMRSSDRSHAIELHENLAEITAWRDSLPDASGSGSLARRATYRGGERVRGTRQRQMPGRSETRSDGIVATVC